MWLFCFFKNILKRNIFLNEITYYLPLYTVLVCDLIGTKKFKINQSTSTVFVDLFSAVIYYKIILLYFYVNF